MTEPSSSIAEHVAELAMDALRARYDFESTPENQSAAAKWTSPDARKLRLQVLAHTRVWVVNERQVTISTVPKFRQGDSVHAGIARRRHAGVAADAAEYAMRNHPNEAVQRGIIEPISPYAYSLRW